MVVAAANAWHETNQEVLGAALARVRQALVQHAGHSQASAVPEADPALSLTEKVAELPVPPALDTLCDRCGLSTFERDILLLCAGIELDAEFAALCAAAQDDAQRNYATFALALAALPGAHWSALTPAGPLRNWQLIRLEPGRSLVHRPICIEERVLHYLVGIDYLDEPLHGLLHFVAPPATLVATQKDTADQVVATWLRGAEHGVLPAVHLRGSESAAKLEIAASACAQLGLALYKLPVDALPMAAAETEQLVRLWAREAVLSERALFIDADAPSGLDAGAESSLAHFLAASSGPIIIASRDRGTPTPIPAVAFDVCKPLRSEQREIWQAALGSAAAKLDGRLDRIVAQFDLDTPSILSAAAVAIGETQAKDDTPAPAEPLSDAVWAACRLQARPQLDDLAQRIEPSATWTTLVLPETQRRILQEIAVHVRQRQQVYEQWGFAEQRRARAGHQRTLCRPQRHRQDDGR